MVYLIKAVSYLTGLFSIAGIGYYLLSMWSARAYLRHKRAYEPGFAPGVTILKPLRGADREIYESFRSHCLQDYPEYEIIFGVSEADDPAVAVVERIQKEFPHRSIRLLVCEKILGTNVKVSNLAQMLSLARYEYLLVNDSDIRVPPGYLCSVMAPLADPRVGVVTCLYRGAAGGTLGSRLEALGISTDFIAGALAAWQIEGGMHFALGSTVALRRDTLQKIGGFEQLVDYLADDFEIGCRAANAGLRVEPAGVVVDTFLPDYSFAGFFAHQLRWARSTRHSRPRGYFGMLFTFGLPWALLGVLPARGALWAWTLLAAALVMRLGMAIWVGWGTLRDRQVLRWWWLVPLRDLVALLIWVAGYTGHTVHWRGGDFVLEKGKLRPV